MERKQTIEQNRKEKSFSEQLVESIANEPFTAKHWQRYADSFPENKQKQQKQTAIAVTIGIVIGALAMHFLSSPERWIRL
ncbi:MAG: hypothetical protein J6R16_04000 [Alistipes sp.]|nr:hypothetical protein [Alistipes sp.]